MTSKTNPLIQKIVKSYENSTGKTRRHTNASRKWFRDNLRRNFGGVRSTRLLADATFHATPKIGGLYLFNYDPKYKDQLPVYDVFPLVFPFALTDDKKGFYGLNMHYLKPKLRMAVFVELLKLKNTSGYRKSTKLALNYRKLMSISKSGAIQHAIKRYRFDHMRSKFIKVDAENWEIVVALPLENFKKGSKSQAWAG